MRAASAQTPSMKSPRLRVLKRAIKTGGNESDFLIIQRSCAFHCMLPQLLIVSVVKNFTPFLNETVVRCQPAILMSTLLGLT